MKPDRRGAALAMVVIATLVLSILAAAVYTLFDANMKSYTWDRDRIQARYTAEAGANLAVDMIMGGASVPYDTLPVQFLPEPPATGWEDLPGDDLGEVTVWVDPSNNNPEVWAGDAYGLRALGRVESQQGTFDYGMETVVVPENFARFATFLNVPPTNGYYGDGYRFDGPFFANGGVCLFSSDASTTNDIWFYRFSLASPGYWYSTGFGGTAPPYRTSPVYGNLSIQPPERMSMGAPYFELNVDPIAYGPGEVDWGDARNAAISGGLYFGPGTLDDRTRMILRNDTLLVKESNAAAVQRFYLGDLVNPVVWIDNGAAQRVYLKSMPPYVTGTAPWCQDGLSMPLTIGVNGSLFVSGTLQYQNRDLQDAGNFTMLGIIIVYGNFTIAVDPESVGGTDWTDPVWRIVTNADIEYDMVVMDLNGAFNAENWNVPPGPVDFMVMGGYIVNTEGYTTTPSSGYDTVIYYDPRLLSMHPPFFPQTGRWDVVYWAEKPDLDLDSVDEHWF